MLSKLRLLNISCLPSIKFKIGFRQAKTFCFLYLVLRDGLSLSRSLFRQWRLAENVKIGTPLQQFRDQQQQLVFVFDWKFDSPHGANSRFHPTGKNMPCVQTEDRQTDADRNSKWPNQYRMWLTSARTASKNPQETKETRADLLEACGI